MINYEQLDKELSEMTERSRIFQLVKKHMIARGRWRVRSRGIPFVKGEDSRRSDKRFGS